MGSVDGELIQHMSRFFPSQRVISGLLIFLSLSALYLYAFPQTNLFYPIIVLLHALAGVVAVGLLFVWLWRRLKNETFFGRVGWTLIVAGGILGLVLIKTGTPRAEWNWLYPTSLSLQQVRRFFLPNGQGSEAGWGDWEGAGHSFVSQFVWFC